MAQLYVGTSGWSYKDWGKHFYPSDLPAREQLAYIAKHFPTVEINSSFYRLPLAKTFKNWHDQVPPEFRFAVKISKFISHFRLLNEVEDSWRLLLERSSPMAEKVGSYLLQLPPSFHATPENIDRLESFLAYATTDARVAVELRHRSWFETEGLAVFERQKACLVQAESARYPHSPEHFAPADFAYFRFHGPRELYSSAYNDEELSYWASQIKWHLDRGKDVFVYFDNDVNAYALTDALRLRDLLGQ